MNRIYPSNFYKIICSCLGGYGVKMWYCYVYFRIRQKLLNTKKPSNMSEYIIKCVLNKESNKKISTYADKYLVRNYIKSKGLSDILLNCYGVWDEPAQIDFEQLPNMFALKANNGSGGHVFCIDKSKLNKVKAVNQLKKTMLIDGIDYNFEPHYKYIKPKIYAEELIQDNTKNGIVDYKFMCVGGTIHSVLIVYNRQPNGDYFLALKDENWNIVQGLQNLLQSNNESCHIPIPKHFSRMKEIARILSADFEFVRVDLYEYKDSVYFGELTFTPQGGRLTYFTTSYLEDIYNKMIYELSKK